MIHYNELSILILKWTLQCIYGNTNASQFEKRFFTCSEKEAAGNLSPFLFRKRNKKMSGCVLFANYIQEEYMTEKDPLQNDHQYPIDSMVFNNHCHRRWNQDNLPQEGWVECCLFSKNTPPFRAKNSSRMWIRLYLSKEKAKHPWMNFSGVLESIFKVLCILFRIQATFWKANAQWFCLFRLPSVFVRLIHCCVRVGFGLVSGQGSVIRQECFWWKKHPCSNCYFA